MRISQINFPSLSEFGLGPIRMERLGKTVVIAGRNGAGKSRLIKQLLGIRQIRNAARTARINLANARRRPEADRTESERAEIGLWEASVDLASKVTVEPGGEPRFVPFVPSKLLMPDPHQMTKASLLQNAKQVEVPGVQHLAEGAFARIQAVQDRMWEATHQRRTPESEEVESATNECAKLENIIEQFLGSKLTRSLNGEAELFGLPLGKSALSDGQKVVLQLCVAIHAQGATLNDVIILMDEPENHLHPAALLDLVTTIQDRLTTGQIWIATHSIPLLAEVDASSIWWMEDNTISKAGDQPARVLYGLLGDENRRDRLAAFLDLPFTLASNRFAAECLVPPAVVAAKSGDPQNAQIRRAIETLAARDHAIRVLDFGAGKGRLASELSEAYGGEASKHVDYIAYDPSNGNVEECSNAIARLYGTSDARLFQDLTELRARYDEGSFHVVVMCNVLHEILPADWGDLFGAEGKITRLLSDDGFVLLVEVQQLPYGERAHQQGFLVLDTAQLRKLFSIQEADLSRFIVDQERDGWLKAHLVGKPLLTRYSSATRESALKDLASTARDRIRQLREGKGDYRSGRLHGFWVQQFANAQLALG